MLGKKWKRVKAEMINSSEKSSKYSDEQKQLHITLHIRNTYAQDIGHFTHTRAPLDSTKSNKKKT